MILNMKVRIKTMTTLQEKIEAKQRELESLLQIDKQENEFSDLLIDLYKAQSMKSIKPNVLETLAKTTKELVNLKIKTMESSVVTTETKKQVVKLRKSHATGFVHHRNEYVSYLLHENGLSDEKIAKIFSDKHEMDVKSGVQPLGKQVLTTSKDVEKRRNWLIANNKLETWSKDKEACQKVVDSLLLSYK